MNPFLISRQSMCEYCLRLAQLSRWRYPSHQAWRLLPKLSRYCIEVPAIRLVHPVTWTFLMIMTNYISTKCVSEVVPKTPLFIFQICQICFLPPFVLSKFEGLGFVYILLEGQNESALIFTHGIHAYENITTNCNWCSDQSFIMKQAL